MIGKKTVGAIMVTALLIMWQIRTIKKKIADLSGPFNDIITVCINSMPISNDTPFKNAGAHFKYERFHPFSGATKKQTCYVKLVFDRNNKTGYAGRYRCGLLGSQADQTVTALGLKPCNIFFHGNKNLKQKFDTLDADAISANTMHEAIEKLSK